MNFRDIERHYESLRKEDAARRAYYRALMEEDEAFLSAEREEKQANLALYRAEFEEDAAAEKRAKARAEKANAAKNAHLAAHGLTPDHLRPHYVCEKCRDTGFIDEKPCSCYFEVRKKLLLTEGACKDFPSFSDCTAESQTLQTRLNNLKGFAERFPETVVKTLVFSGKTGTGKTHLMQALCKELETRGFSVAYYTALELNNAFLNYHTKKEGRADGMDRLLLCDLLAIDDLGTEPVLRNVTKEYLLSVLSTRALRGKHTVITTNLNPAEVMARYEERTFSRLVDKRLSKWLSFTGKDLRWQK